MTHDQDHLQASVLTVAQSETAVLDSSLTVREALEQIRHSVLGEKIVYFYAIDSHGRLAGVLPTRRLLTAPLDRTLASIMITQMTVIPSSATVLEACEMFARTKFLALPVVDPDRKLAGVVDIGLLTEQAFDVAERQQTDAIFEAIGFRVSQVRDAGPLWAFRYRFPWLMATIGSGTLCALLASAFEVTLAKSIVLAFFLTLVLGLAESVGIQSMTLTVQALRAMEPSWPWYFRTLRREACTAVLLGAACGFVVGVIVYVWRGAGFAAFAIGSSIGLALCAACLFGLSVPTLLHALKLDPKIAAGPVTLALTDLATLLCYFSLAAWLL